MQRINPQVDEYLQARSGNQREIMLLLDQMLMTYPGVVRKMRFKVPFYDRKSWICYLNPLKKDAVELAFIRGNIMKDEHGLLVANGRKMVKGLRFSGVDDIPFELLGLYIEEALRLDDVSKPMVVSREKR